MRSATQALTIVAEIADRTLLQARLDAIADDLGGNEVFRPCDLPDTHFMRFVIIKDDELPWLLAWESNHDGDDYLLRVLLHAPTIRLIFECCTGFPVSDDAEQLAWLRAHRIRAAAFYAGYRGIPRKQIANDRAVHDAIREVIDDPRNRTALVRQSPPQIHHLLACHLRDRHALLDIRTDDGDEPRWLLDKVIAAILAIPILALMIPIAPIWYLVLRAKEESDPTAATERAVRDVHGLARFEDHITQNQLTHVVDIKPGWFRLVTLRAVLAAIDVAARVYSVRGDLGGITSIHFARWVIVKDPRGKRHRLVFFSNYDGSWESYLGEFIDRAAFGLTAIWSNTVGFPYTRNLYQAGARDEEAFKNWTRCHQIRTQVWWSGVPDSTVQNIRDDVWIRRQIDRGLADEEVSAWLRKL